MKPDYKPLYDIAVVGAGPVGSTAALLAAQQGLSCILLESKQRPGIHPAAHVINARTMEVWRGIDPKLESEIRNTSVDPFELRNVLWCTSLAGRELGRINIVGEDSENALQFMDSSPTRPVHFSQNKLEPLLWRQIGQVEEGIDFMTGAKVTSIDANDAHGVTFSVDQSKQVRSRYLIAADGAKSPIRKQLGIVMDGPVLQNVISIYFKANLDRFVRTRPAILHWVLNDETAGVFICHDHRSHEWVFMLPYIPPQRPRDFDEQRCLQALYGAIGSRAIHIDILSIGSWAMTAQVAESYRSQSVFLAGDAAHRFPPTGGYGLNTGVQDVHNLLWKMGGLLTGKYKDSILDTYWTERYPVAVSNCQFSVDNNEKMAAINKAVGLNPNNQKLLTTLFNVPGIRSIPDDIKSKVVDGMVKGALRPLATLDADSKTGQALRATVASLMPMQKKHFVSLGQDLGFAYKSKLVVNEPEPQPRAENAVVDYRPTTWPGARLPHFWIQAKCEHQRLSVLDLIDGQSWLMLCQSPNADWARLFHNLAQSEMGRFDLLRLCTLGPEDDCDYLDSQNGFVSLWELEATGALIVRPDGHVFWRSKGGPTDSDQLETVVKHIYTYANPLTVKKAEAV